MREDGTEGEQGEGRVRERYGERRGVTMKGGDAAAGGNGRYGGKDGG